MNEDERQHFMECSARAALRHYPTKEKRKAFYGRMYLKKKKLVGHEKAMELVNEFKALMKAEWEKQNGQ